jgi:hypothetical protein
MDNKELVKQEITPVVMPAVTPAEAKKIWNEYEKMKLAVLDPKNDIQKIQGRDFKKKGYWRKLATFFNLSIEVVEERAEEIKNNEGQVVNKVWHFVVRATAPNGRSVIGSGSCDMLEKGTRNTYHNTRSTAETRAYNRAVSNLVGGGEVSAEEVGKDYIEVTEEEE